LAGVAAPRTTFVQLRIVDDALEAEPTSQYEGDFWGLYLATEQEDGRFLEEHDLPDSNFYKMEGGSGELNNLGPYGPTDKSDLNGVLNNYTGASDAWWRGNWNLPNYYSYQAIVQAIHHFDISDNKNYFYFTNSNTGRWEIMPWDLDLAWAHNMYRSDVNGAGVDRLAERILNPYKEGGVGLQTGTGVMRLSGTRPVFEIEFRNRLREIRDLLFNSDQAFALIDEFAQLLGYPSATPGLLEADRAQWDYNPKMADGAYTPNLGKAGQGRFYQFPLESGTNAALRGSFAATVQIMKNYVNIRASLLDELAYDPSIPSPSSVTYIGPAGYPLNRLQFRSSAYVGTQTFAAMKWRIAEFTDTAAAAYDPAEPRAYEVTPAWESADLIAFSSDVNIPVEAVRVGHAYRVRVRMQDTTGRWSAWSAPAQFVVGPPDQAAAMLSYLRFTELMYQPPAGADYEFIELHNASTNLTLDLAGAKFTSGVDFTFPAGTTIPPGGYRLVVGTTNLAAFRAYYGLDPTVAISGPYGGSLNNGGEQLTLKTAAGGTEITAFLYADGMGSTAGRGWPVAAAGAGHSLVPLDRASSGQASGALDYPGNWRASTHLKGSPGRADPSAPLVSVVINEIAAHTDYYDPARPEYDSNDWLELYNAGTTDLTLAAWYLSDDPLDLRKWQIPAVTLSAHARLSFDEISGFHAPITSGFGLNKAGEQVLLAYLPGNAGDRVVDAVRFEGQENGVAWGRYPDGAWLGDTLNRTRDAANTAPLRSVVINEIMYCPPSADGITDNLNDEYLELWNPTSQAVDLFTTNGAWRIEGGVRYTFPPQTVLPAGATLVLVNFDPADAIAVARFRQVYGLTNTVVTFLGPYAGKLSNRSDRLGLERPQAPDLPGDSYSWVILDEVIYGNQNPWPSAARIGGAALQRLAVAGNGNDPDNWSAVAPTPGTAGSSDSDADGLPDAWEAQYQLDPRDPTDAPLDPDADGLTNLQEYRAGTNPQDANSVLRFEAVDTRNNEVMLRFWAVAGHAYTVLYREDPCEGPWIGLRNIDASSTNTLRTVSDELPPSRPSRSYRLVTPAVP
jgi:hypothetical protein